MIPVAGVVVMVIMELAVKIQFSVVALLVVSIGWVVAGKIYIHKGLIITRYVAVKQVIHADFITPSHREWNIWTSYIYIPMM